MQASLVVVMRAEGAPCAQAPPCAPSRRARRRARPHQMPPPEPQRPGYQAVQRPHAYSRRPRRGPLLGCLKASPKRALEEKARAGRRTLCCSISAMSWDSLTVMSSGRSTCSERHGEFRFLSGRENSGTHNTIAQPQAKRIHDNACRPTSYRIIQIEEEDSVWQSA